MLSYLLSRIADRPRHDIKVGGTDDELRLDRRTPSPHHSGYIRSRPPDGHASGNACDQNGVDLIRYGLEQALQGHPRYPPFHELGRHKLARSVSCRQKVKLALGRLHFGDIDVKEADGIAFEPLALRLVAIPPASGKCRAAVDTDAAPTVRCGIIDCSAERQSSSSRSACRRNMQQRPSPPQPRSGPTLAPSAQS